jgi:two-component system cell cycle response regulator DivK
MELILAVDDDKSFLDMVSNQLNTIGYRVIKASSGAEGVEMARTGNPDLILLDIGMPVMDGFKVLTQLKVDENLRDIPVIMITSTAKKEDLHKAMRYGVIDYILKPYDVNIFSKKIQSALKYSQVLKDKIESERSQHIEISRSGGKTVIAFLSRLREKYVIDEARRIFSSHFLKTTQKDTTIVDLRSLPDLSPEEMPIVEAIVKLFPDRELFIVAGRHYGTVIAEADFDDRIHLFISFGDLELHLEKGNK